MSVSHSEEDVIHEVKIKHCESCNVIKTIDNSPKVRSAYCRDCYNKSRRKPKVDHHCMTCNVLLTADNKRTNKECKSCRSIREREARQLAKQTISKDNNSNSLDLSSLALQESRDSREVDKEDDSTTKEYSNEHEYLRKLEMMLNGILLELRTYL